MEQRPEISFLCGPMGLDRILAWERGNENERDERLWAYESTERGTSLAQMHELAQEVGLDLAPMKRAPGSGEVPVPALVNWKVGHFAALVARRDGRYLVQDPTFGNEIWVTEAAIDHESSGYFLVASNHQAEGWEAVDVAEAGTVWGKGTTTSSDAEATTSCDTQSPSSCPGGTSCPPGMATYSFHLLLASLNIQDEPVGYDPPFGPSVRFRATYSHREAFQPQIFSYSNLGASWTFDWLGYVEDDPADLGQPAYVYRRGGGRETYTSFDVGTQSYALHRFERTQLARVSQAPIRYERLGTDGSKQVYSQPDGAATAPRRVFLTEVVDAQGNAISFTYDGSLRLVAVTDAIGQVTTLSYDDPDALKITKVTDPFGRFATLDYDGDQLIRITDVIGLTSELSYDETGFITALTTPYGTTEFNAGESGAGSTRRRWLEAKDPLGGVERAEYRDTVDPSIIPDAIPAALKPTGMDTTLAAFPNFNNARNTYYWDKLAMDRAPQDYTKARIYHWVHTADRTQAGRVLEWFKMPLENHVWYNYQDQGAFAPVVEGVGRQPTKVGRVLDDGSTQLYQYEYNSKGKVTKEIDPVGRQTTYCYDTNEVDLLQVRQTTGRLDTDPDACTGAPGTGINELLTTATYDAQHRLLTLTDAVGQTSTNTYTSDGRIETVVSPARDGLAGTPLSAAERTTTYEYYPLGAASGERRLRRVTGPLTAEGSTMTQLTYDAIGRLATFTDPSQGARQESERSRDHAAGR